MAEPIRTWKYDKAPLEVRLLKPNTVAKCSYISAVPHSFHELPPWWEYLEMTEHMNYNYYFH